MSSKMEQQVREFHEKFGADIGDKNLPRFKNATLRKNLLVEEVDEFVRAVEWGNFDEAVHEAIDILYVTFGALIAWGITDIDDYFTQIHNANMKKIGGKTREDGKIMKPDGWQKADIGILIRTQPTRLSKRETFELGTPMIDPPSVDVKIEINDEKIIDTITEIERKKRGRPARTN